MDATISSFGDWDDCYGDTSPTTNAVNSLALNKLAKPARSLSTAPSGNVCYDELGDIRDSSDIFSNLESALPTIGQSQYTRLVYLVNESIDEQETNVLDLDSLAGYVSFLKKFNPKHTPDITITSSGRIYSTWRKSAIYKFSIEIINRTTLLYVAIYGEGGKNDEYGKKEIRRLGSSPLGETEINALLGLPQKAT